MCGFCVWACGSGQRGRQRYLFFSLPRTHPPLPTPPSLHPSLVGAPAHDPRGAAATYTYGSSAAPGTGWTPASAGSGSGSARHGHAANAPPSFYPSPYQPRGSYMEGGSGSTGRSGRRGGARDGGGGPDPPPAPRGGGPAALSLAAAAVDALACLVPDATAPDAAARVAMAATVGLGMPVREAAVATLLSWRDRLF